MATPSCYMYIHSMKNINFKNFLTLNFFFEFNVEQRINQLKLQKLWLVDIQPEKTTRVFFGKYHAHKHGHYICSWSVGWNNSIKISSRIYTGSKRLETKSGVF